MPGGKRYGRFGRSNNGGTSGIATARGGASIARATRIGNLRDHSRVAESKRRWDVFASNLLCFVCGKPSLRQWGHRGACKQHVSLLKVGS